MRFVCKIERKTLLPSSIRPFLGKKIGFSGIMAKHRAEEILGMDPNIPITGEHYRQLNSDLDRG